mgnify:CR=1 FL=1
MILSMIPRGICIDLETTIAGKISDAVRVLNVLKLELLRSAPVIP